MFRDNNLGQDFFGPPAQGQTYSAFQDQMKTVATVVGIGTLAIINPVVGVIAGAVWLFSRPETQRASNRFSSDELKGGH